ncbi:MAG TPA: O-antigen ligase family protein [Sphingobium sp.]|uniref:O-antigen ligase family protein n=1 Tax=Sphingobium sp. TaxID=1912891 RepID=UPI002ED4463D
MISARDSWHLTGIVTACLCVGLYADGLDSPTGQSIACLMTAIALCAAIAVIRPPEEFWRIVRRPLFLIAAALVWLLTVQAVRVGSPVRMSGLPLAPDLFLAKFLSIVAGLFALLTGAVLGWKAPRPNSAAGWILFFLCTHLVLGIGMSLMTCDGIWSAWTIVEHERFKGMIGNANVTAAMCAVGTILSFACLMDLWTRAYRDGMSEVQHLFLGLFIASLLLNLIVLAMTASRFPAVVTLAGMSLLIFSQRHLAAGRRYRRFWGPVAICVAAVAISQVFFSGLLVERIGNLEAETYSRTAAWNHFFDMAASAPWTGFGPGTFTIANLYYLQEEAAGTGLWIVNSPHSILLQLWFNGGIPYLLLMLAAAGMIFRDVCRRIDLGKGDAGIIGLFLAGVSVVACAMVDIVLDYPVGTQIAFFLVGLAWTSSHNPKGRHLLAARRRMKTVK